MQSGTVKAHRPRRCEFIRTLNGKAQALVMTMNVRMNSHLQFHRVRAFQVQHLTRFIGRGDFQRQAFQHLARESHLLG